MLHTQRDLLVVVGNTPVFYIATGRNNNHLEMKNLEQPGYFELRFSGCILVGSNGTYWSLVVQRTPGRYISGLLKFNTEQRVAW